MLNYYECEKDVLQCLEATGRYCFVLLTVIVMIIMFIFMWLYYCYTCTVMHSYIWLYMYGLYMVQYCFSTAHNFSISYSFSILFKVF